MGGDEYRGGTFANTTISRNKGKEGGAKSHRNIVATVEDSIAVTSGRIDGKYPAGAKKAEDVLDRLDGYRVIIKGWHNTCTVHTIHYCFEIKFSRKIL